VKEKFFDIGRLFYFLFYHQKELIQLYLSDKHNLMLLLYEDATL
jgi:hypothetical protein